MDKVGFGVGWQRYLRRIGEPVWLYIHNFTTCHYLFYLFYQRVLFLRGRASFLTGRSKIERILLELQLVYHRTFRTAGLCLSTPLL